MTEKDNLFRAIRYILYLFVILLLITIFFSSSLFRWLYLTTYFRSVVKGAFFCPVLRGLVGFAQKHISPRPPPLKPRTAKRLTCGELSRSECKKFHVKAHVA